MNKGISVKLPNELIDKIKIDAKKEFKSIPKQIEYLCRVGKTLEENKAFNYDDAVEFIRGNKVLDEKYKKFK